MAGDLLTPNMDGDEPSAIVLNATAQGSSSVSILDTQFDIANFHFTLPAVLETTRTFDMDGLRFYSGSDKIVQQNNVTFGSSDAPTWTLIGLIGPTFTPMLLTYGVTTLNYGNNFNDFVSWTDGIYTVANKLAIRKEPTSPAEVFGGMQIQPLDGGFFSDSLLSDGTSYTITGIANGVVTTSTANTFTSGQQLQFSNLTGNLDTNGHTTIDNGNDYIVDQILSPTSFTVKAIDGHDVSQATASGGNVTSLGSPSDSQNWGVLVPNGQQMQLMDNAQRGQHNVFLGFTPTRMLLTKTTDAVSQPMLQFAGVQTIGYKGGHLQAGVGLQTAGNAYYLQVDYLGYYKLVNSDDSNDNEFVATISVGQNALTPRINTSGIVNGTVNTTGTPHGLTDGDWIHFTQLNLVPAADGSPPLISIGTSYQVDVINSTSFRLIDPATNQPMFDPSLNATSATAVKEVRITDISQQQIVDSSGQTVTHLVVTTAEAHKLTIGDAIVFKELQLTEGTIPDGTYYVTSVIGSFDGTSTQFTFGDAEGNDYNPLVAVKGTTGRVTAPLFKAGGVFLGGDATLKVSFNGGFQAGDFLAPTDFKIELSGSLSLFKDFGNGLTIGGVASLKGDKETSEGLVLQSVGGDFSVPAWGFNLTGNIVKSGTFNLALSGISASSIRDETGRETIAVNGTAQLTVIPWSWAGTVVMGHGQTNGFTIIHEADGTVWLRDMSVTVIVDRLKPPDTQNPDTKDKKQFLDKISILGLDADISWSTTSSNNQDFELGIGGLVSLAIGDPTPDADGNWKSDTSTINVSVSPDIIKIDHDGIHIKKTAGDFFEAMVNGPFTVKGFTVIARDLAFKYTFADPAKKTDSSAVLSGGVIIPSLNNASIEFGVDGASGGLYIDTQTGKWKLDGWRIAIPKFRLGPIMIQNFVLGFSGSGDHANPDGSTDTVIQAGGQMAFFKNGGLVIGLDFTVELEGGKFKILDIGATLRNLNPGLPIPGIEGAFLTDISFQIDGIPHSISFDALLGAVLGERIQVGGKEYAMFQALLSGEYKDRDITITGEVLFAGGVLGDVTGTIDLDWGKGTYTLDFDGKFFHDIFETQAYLYFSEKIDAGLFSGSVQVPSDIPIIGGLHVLQSDMMFYVDHSDGGDRFFAAWFDFAGRWKYGLKADYNDHGKVTGVGTKTINGLIGQLPGGTGSQLKKYNVVYTPSDAIEPLASTGSLGANASGSTVSYGLIEVTWNNPDSQDEIAIAGGDGDAVIVWGPGAQTNVHGWVEDTANGISYMVVADHSRPGDIIIHVAPTAAFTVEGASYDDPDLYVPLPDLQLNVVLQTNNEQSVDPTVDWHAGFSAPAPEIQNLTITQPQPSDALNNDTAGPDPVTANNATISFQWRGLDPDNTDVTLFFDFNNGGYKGSVLKSLASDDLTISDPDEDGWRTVTVAWDLADLKPGVPIYVYAVIKDDAHAPVTTDYAGQVQSVPAAQVQVVYTDDTNVTPNELQGLPLMVTPVKEFDVTSIAGGVVTVTSTAGLNIGDTFMFSGLASATGVSNSTLYFITSISGATFQYSTTAAGGAIVDSSAGSGVAYVDQGPSGYYATDKNGVVSPHVDVFQTYRFSMAPTRGVFAAQPSAGQEVSWIKELVQYNTFEGHNQLLRMQFEFKVQTAIAGTIYNDFEDDGLLDSFDTGLKGVTVFLDDNNNGVLDAGEQSTITDVDGTYLFVHTWADTDTPASTYTTRVKVIPPVGYKVTSSPAIPATGITFTNDGNAQTSLDYYNFLIASPIVLGGVVYADTNGNGVRDPGEKGIAGANVTITPPSGGAILATTDATGAWSATAYVRGDYKIDVDAPNGGTITTPTTSFSFDGASTIAVHGSFDFTNHYSNSGTTSLWDPVTQQYRPWLLAMIDDVEPFNSQGVNFVDLSGGETGSANALNTVSITEIPKKYDVFLGKWSASGEPTPLLTYLWDNDTAVLAASPANSIDGILFPSLGNDDAYERFALSYDPSNPDYSTVASVNSSGQVIRWVFDPTKFGKTVDGPYEPYFTPGQTLFQLPSGATPVKMVGFNMTGSDHLKSQDLAVAYLSQTYNVPQVAIWNHATNTLQSFEVGGRTVVDMITGDFNVDGREDIAVLTMDIADQDYYLTVLLTQSDGSITLLRHEGADIAVAADGTPLTNLSSVRVFGGQQAILWNTKDGDSYINAALVTGEQIRIATEKTAFAGNIVALSAGDVGTPAKFAVYAPGQTSGHVIGTFVGSINVDIDGTFAVDSELTKYGGTFSGYDIGVTGSAPAASTTTSGIVFNDANSNGFQDPGESGLPGITLRLVTPGGSIVTTTSSDGSDGRAVGSYRFDHVAPNSYIQIALPSGSWLAQNPPQGVDTNSNGTDGLLVGVAFTGGAPIETLPFDAPTDNPYSISVKSGDLQNKGRENLVIRTADSLYVQYFGVDGSTSFSRYDVGSPAGYFKPELELADLNGDGRLDIVTSGQSGVDVFVNIAFGQFKPYLGVLADLLNNTPNGSYSVKGAFTGDLDSGVTAAKTYTHALNFNGPATTVNGVLFAAAGPTGTNYSLQSIDPATQTAGTLGAFGNFDNNLTGAMNALASDFYYSFGESLGDERLTLTGLTAGVTYTTTFYSVGFGAGQRQQIVFDSLGGSVKLDEDSTGSGNGFMFSRTFTATGDSITFTFVAQESNSFHQYALTNEIAPVGFTTAQPLIGDDDTPIDSGHHYTHALDFAGDQAVNVSGVAFTQATPQGSNYSLVAYDPVSQTTSPGVNVFTGYSNALTGGLNSAASNFYYSPTGSSQLTLTGLLVGATYTTTFYGVGFGSGVARVSTITDSLGGSVVIDENLFGDRQGFQFSRTFVATGDSITFTFIALDPADGFHHYAITNQLVDDQSNYSIEALPGDAGSEVSSSKTYTHSIDFNGTGNVAVNGVSFNQTAASGANYSLTAINPVDLTESSMQAVTGFANNLAGQFNSAASNYFFSPTGASKLTLTGLTAGVTYTATFYVVGNGNVGARQQSIADSLGGSYYVDQNLEGNGRGIRITRTYTATSDTMVFWFMGDDANAGFNHYAMTNEVTALEPGSPAVYSTEIAIAPGKTSGAPDRILAVQQNTGIIYEIALDGKAAPVATGNVFAIDHAIIKMDVGDVSAVGANDLVIYETRSSDPSDPFTSPIDLGLQQVWILAASSNYATGTLAMDLGNFTYQPRVDLAIAPLFAGSESIVFLGNRFASSAMDVLTYRTGSSVQTTSKAGFVGYGLNVGQFIANSSVPNVVIAGENAITVLVPGNDPGDSDNPTGFDPNVPLVEAGTTMTGSTIAAAIGLQTGAHYDELMVVQYVEGTGYVVQSYFNTTDSYRAGTDADGAIYDFAVVVPGSGGGVIAGNVFYDTAGNGQWDPSAYGIYDGVTIYLDLNNNGKFDPTEQSTTPDLDGNFRFSHLLPKVYTVGIQLGAGYNATSPVSYQVVVPALPRAATYGIDFGVQAKNFGVDFNNDKQADVLLTDPTSNGVYVQLRNGLNRLSTYKIGDLPSADWSVVGLYDLSANGTTDVLLHNVRTGQLQVWDLFPGQGVPVVAGKRTLDYIVPANFAVAGVGDLNGDGTPDIVLVHSFTGEHRLVQIAGNTASESRLPIANTMQVVGVGDLDGDGDTDLLLQRRGSDALFAQLYENGQFLPEKSLGSINPTWSVAGITDLIFGGPSEILFQDRSTGKGYAWTLTSHLAVEKSVEVDVGSHSGLLLHLSDQHTLSRSAITIQGFAGAADVTYQENGAPLVIGGVGTIVDPQHSDFAGSTLTVWLRVNGTEDDRLSIKHSGNASGKVGVNHATRVIRYGGIAIATYTGGVGIDSLVITFTSAATKDAVQAVLKAITFANVSDNPSAARRAVSFAITDGEGRVSNIVSRGVRITPVNDRPILTVSGSTARYTEGGAPAIVDNNILVLDVDSRNFAGGVLTAKIASGGQTTDRLAIQSSGLIGVDETTRAVSYGGKRIGTYAGTTTLAITFNGNATAQIIQDLARHIAFSTISDAPSSTLRQINFTLSDGDGGQSTVASGDTVRVTPTNDPPVLAYQNPNPARYIENAVPILVASGATVADADQLNFQSGTLTVELTRGGTTTDMLGIKNVGTRANQVSVVGNSIRFTSSAGSTYQIATFTGGTGTIPLVILFNNKAFKTEVEGVLNAITFANSSDNPSIARRNISFTLTDGDGGTSNTLVRNLDIIPRNDRPILTNFGPAIDYVRGSSPTLISPTATVVDVDSSNFNGGWVSISITNHRRPSDSLEIVEGNGIAVNGAIVSYRGNVIGNYAGRGPLTVQLTTNFATPDALQALLRQVTFSTWSSSTVRRTVAMTLSDGDGGTSASVSKTISLVNGNAR